MGYGQIPDITDAPDFDPRNPEHLRAFEEEMIEMMTGALEKQARIQRTKRVVNSARGKLTEHEIDLATRGLDVPQVRQAQAVGESCPESSNSTLSPRHRPYASSNVGMGTLEDSGPFIKRRCHLDDLVKA